MGEKCCSICGKSYPTAHFDYGGRTNRSYCQSCSAIDHRLRKEAKRAGKDPRELLAAWRAEMRRQWK